MTKHKSKSASVGAILRTSSGSLAGILAHAERLQKLDTLLAKHMPPDIKQHCHAGNLRGATLVIHAGSPAWAAKLRFLAPQLLRALQHEKNLTRLQRIEIRIQPEVPLTDNEPSKAPDISNASRQHLQAMASTVSDPRLREALRRLAKH